tara:strand:+ start:1201 stop:1407 length:207 start_codon:yes stop_codon:yes gene_type:complete
MDNKKKGEKMDYIEKLTSIYSDWIEKNNLPNESADTLMNWYDLDSDQSDWIERFISLWNRAEKKEGIA